MAKTAQDALSDGTLTAKIKAKIALDDRVKALDLNVDTRDGVVTVTGNVQSSAQRERALALARETNGVRQVVDRTARRQPLGSHRALPTTTLTIQERTH